MTKKPILFITEGAAEKNFIEILFNLIAKGEEYEVYSYDTNIHILAQELTKEGVIDEFLDINLVLREKETDPRLREMLSKNFSDIFLIFDFDPQHSYPSFNKVQTLLDYFTDSTTVGKMYINYPMMESFRHLNQMPDEGFCERAVGLKECLAYKKLVNQESKYVNLQKLNYNILISMAVHHIKKSNYIRKGDYNMPLIEDFEKWTENEVYKKQSDVMANENRIYVVNEFFTYIAYRNPQNFYNQIKFHKDKFDI